MDYDNKKVMREISDKVERLNTYYAFDTTIQTEPEQSTRTLINYVCMEYEKYQYAVDRLMNSKENIATKTLRSKDIYSDYDNRVTEYIKHVVGW